MAKYFYGFLAVLFLAYGCLLTWAGVLGHTTPGWAQGAGWINAGVAYVVCVVLMGAIENYRRQFWD